MTFLRIISAALLAVALVGGTAAIAGTQPAVSLQANADADCCGGAVSTADCSMACPASGAMLVSVEDGRPPYDTSSAPPVSRFTALPATQERAPDTAPPKPSNA